MWAGSSSYYASEDSHGEGLCVRNTFIDVDHPDEHKRRGLRTRTAPAFQLDDCEPGWWEADTDILCCSTLGRNESGASSPFPALPSTPESILTPTDCPDHAPRVHFNDGEDYAVQVKNTFVDLPEDVSPVCRGPRHRTLPTSLSYDARDPADADEAEASEGEGRDDLEEDVICSTPSPCGVFDDVALAFCQLPQMQVQLPVLLPVHQPMPSTRQPQRQLQPAKRETLALDALCEDEFRQLAAKKTVPVQLPVPRATVQGLDISEVDGFTRARWTLDARKLKGSDKQLVSSPFEVVLSGAGWRVSAPFKIMVYPKSAGFKGGASFRKSGGWARVQLKCASELPDDAIVKIRVSVGRGEQIQTLRGPFLHSFSVSSVFGLPRDQADWDFSSAVDTQTTTVDVSMDIDLA